MAPPRFVSTPARLYALKAMVATSATLCALLASVAPAVADVLPPQMHTVAGGGSCSGGFVTLISGGTCDGVLATSVPIASARSVAALPDGGFLYIDAGDDLVREVSPLGAVTTVAGNGTTSDAPSGSLAVDSGLDGPVSVAPLSNGAFLITEYNGAVVRLVSPGSPATATITTIAGTGVEGASSNYTSAGPASTVNLSYPTDAQPLPGGGVLIADTYDNVIRLLSAAAPGATITTIAGGGACNDVSSDCDGLAAGAVALDHPDSVSPLQDGSGGYLIAEYDGDAIREVSSTSSSGTFTTVAGQPGDAGYAGDGGPATLAQLSHPEQVTSTAGGGFVIADTGNDVVRQVSASGTISTLAGNGISTFAGDDGNATDASLFGPTAVSPTTDGSFFVADEDNNRNREITLAPLVTIEVSPSSPNGSGGWYVTYPSVTVLTNETDQSPLLNCEQDPGAVPPAFGAIQAGCTFTTPQTIAENGTHTVYAAAQNAIGDQSLPVGVTLEIDVGPPTITCNAGQSFTYGTAAQATATLSDSVSGPAAETLTTPADTFTLGSHTVQFNGDNNAGTYTLANCTYAVTPVVITPTASSRFAAGKSYTTITQLVIDGVPPAGALSITCHGHGCPFASRTISPRACVHGICRLHGATPHDVSLTRLFAHDQLGPGARLTVTVTAPHSLGRVLTFTIRARKRPLLQTECLEPGAKELSACPAPSSKRPKLR